RWLPLVSIIRSMRLGRSIPSPSENVDICWPTPSSDTMKSFLLSPVTKLDAAGSITAMSKVTSSAVSLTAASVWRGFTLRSSLRVSTAVPFAESHLRRFRLEPKFSRVCLRLALTLAVRLPCQPADKPRVNVTKIEMPSTTRTTEAAALCFRETLITENVSQTPAWRQHRPNSSAATRCGHLLRGFAARSAERLWLSGRIVKQLPPEAAPSSPPLRAGRAGRCRDGVLH